MQYRVSAFQFSAGNRSHLRVHRKWNQVLTVKGDVGEGLEVVGNVQSLGGREGRWAAVVVSAGVGRSTGGTPALAPVAVG